MELIIDWIAGNCPVQAEGTIDGKRFYFRARHTCWVFEVGDCEWERTEKYGDGPYDAGWMTEEEAGRITEESARLYHAAAPFFGCLT